MPDTPTDFKHFIRIIGRGQRAGRTLTMEEAQQAMSMLINGQVTAEQKGAFLMLLRVREETAAELAGFSLAFRALTPTNITELAVDLDMGCYAGKRRHLPWFLLSVLLLAKSGKRIFLHGTHEPDSKRLYLKEVLPQLGFEISQNPEQARVALDTFGRYYSIARTIWFTFLRQHLGQNVKPNSCNQQLARHFSSPDRRKTPQNCGIVERSKCIVF